MAVEPDEPWSHYLSGGSVLAPTSTLDGLVGLGAP